MMDKLAGGSGGVGPVFHGREGDGATLTLDMAVAVRGPTGRGNANSNPVYKAFHGDGAGRGQRNVGHAARAAAVGGVAAKRWAKRAREESGEGSGEESDEGSLEESEDS
jgi:hypothetical protein